ncbi:MAG: UvrD-helicase domain-containing protein [Bacteroidales bacterium]|nr:UvrD-helicase domain-containing protein [Bacteroidales bacterium]
MSAILEDLNKEQRQAVESVEGPVLIVAGAGSGKTRVLTSRIAYMIEKGTDPSRILALTFTKKAATEMKERIAGMVGERKARRIWMGTFHSVFIRFLREFADAIGFPPTFTIYDTGDSVSAVKACIKQLGLDDKMYKPKEVLARISKAKNDLVTPTPYANGAGGYREDDRVHKKPEIYRVYQAYCQLCRQSGVMDFDDILLYMNILLRGNQDALVSIRERFDAILVDEYQDTNMAQYLILRKLADVHRNLCVVGDDSQSIYAFRGAKIENILNFKKDFPEARTFRLECNYRSTKNIVNAANSLISKNESRIPKQCVSMGEEGEKIRLVRAYTEQEEASLIASEILQRMHSAHAEYEDFAILYRTNAQSRALEEQLRKRNIPYIIYSGNSFFERAEVKDMMAYFKLAANPRDDESFKRAVNKPARGIGDTSLQALAAAAQSHATSLMEAAWAEDLESFGLKNAAIGKIRGFCSMIGKVAETLADTDAYTAAKALANDSGLYAFYKSDNSIEGQARAANVQELLDSVAGYVEEEHGNFKNELIEDGKYTDPSDVPDSELPLVTLPAFLENISLLSNVDVAEDETSNKVALMTAHSAKGLEFPYVFVSGMEENLFPSGGWMLTEPELEEERRLFYVAITRAKKAVALTYAQTRMRNGKHESNAPSRFLREIAPQYLQNPLRKEDFMTERVMDDEVHPGFRFGGFRSGSSSSMGRRSDTPAGLSGPRRPEPKNLTPSRPTTLDVVRNRPLPPKVPDTEFTPDPMSSFKVGDAIEHNRFGVGKVLEISGEVPDIKAKVSFESYGEKILLLKYAKIRHISLRK